MTVLVNDKSTIRNVSSESTPLLRQRVRVKGKPLAPLQTSAQPLVESAFSLPLVPCHWEKRHMRQATNYFGLPLPSFTILRNMFLYSTHIYPYLLWVHQLILHTVSVQRFQEIHGNTLTCESGPNPTFPRGHPWATPESSQNTPGTPRMFLEPFALPATAHPEATRKPWWKEITVGKMQLSKASFPKMVRCVLDLLEKFVELSHVLLV